MSDWKQTRSAPAPAEAHWTCPEGQEIMTKIHDEHGERNVQTMMRRGNLFYINVGQANEMYVYYTPTHWRPL